MILPFLLALLAFGALLPIVAPLLRGSRPGPQRVSFDQAVYRDQLHELDRDIARGLITPAEADSARLEIQRRLLAADRRPATAARLSRSPVLATVVFLVITLGSVGSYLWLGAPGMPDEPYASRAAELAQPSKASSMAQAATRLAEKLKQDPSDAQGWLLYGRSLAMLSRWDQAEDAYRHAIALGQTSPDVLGDHAEMLVLQAGGTVTPAAEAAFQQVLKADPRNGIARYYMAIAAMQAGEPRRAIDGLQALLAELPMNSSLRPQLAQKVAEAAQSAGMAMPELAAGPPPAGRAEPNTVPGPDVPGSDGRGPDARAVAEAAKLSDEQRQAMVRGMVATLAAKQQADPSNLDGWLRLGRAYGVLHEPDKAADAFDRAAALKPDDITIRWQEAQALLSGHAPTDRLAPRVIALLKQMEVKYPNEPQVLWYLGMAAAQDRNPAAAQRYWGRLMTEVEPGSEEARMIQSALDAVSGNAGPGG